MKFTGTTKIGVIAAVLTTALAAAAPASADSFRGYFGDRDGAARVVIHDNNRDFRDPGFRDRGEMWRHDVFFRHAHFHHYGWNWRQQDREVRY